MRPCGANLMTTSPAKATVKELGTPSGAETESLRQMMLYCVDGFPTYRRSLEKVGVSRDAILSGDPMELLRLLPILESDDLHSLSTEVLNSVDSIVDTETSSGTSGSRKIRFITHDDNVAEHKFLAKLLAVAGMNHKDRVACVDTDPACRDGVVPMGV